MRTTGVNRFLLRLVSHRGRSGKFTSEKPDLEIAAACSEAQRPARGDRGEPEPR